jgi:hypothetical protein
LSASSTFLRPAPAARILPPAPGAHFLRLVNSATALVRVVREIPVNSDIRQTLDSVIHAKEVFGQTEVTVISQQFQDQRAIFIANHWGLNAIGFNAQDVVSPKTRFREHFARVRALLDIYLFRTKPTFLRDRVARVELSDLKSALPILPSSSSRSH